MQSKDSGRPGWITLPEREKNYITKTIARLVFLHWKDNRHGEQIGNTVIYIYIYILTKMQSCCTSRIFGVQLWHLCRLLSFWWTGCNLGPYLDGSPHCGNCPVFDRVVDGQARESRFEGRRMPFVAVISYTLLFCISLHIVKTTL